jgi:hypothetical protein
MGGVGGWGKESLWTCTFLTADVHDGSAEGHHCQSAPLEPLFSEGSEDAFVITWRASRASCLRGEARTGEAVEGLCVHRPDLEP